MLRIAAVFGLAVLPQGHGQESPDPAVAAGIHGGLVVQLGASDTRIPAAWSLTGRYLVQILDPNAAMVEAARKELQAKGRYGLVVAERLTNSNRLPFAENLVNLVVLHDFATPPAEMFRVLTPGGKIVVTDPQLFTRSQLEAAGFASVREQGSLLVARKPWPDSMDAWTHPRHDAGGNAVSQDTLVGPPERVRWIAAALSEVEGLVTAAGRNYYGGILARDSFNGLRLWHRDLNRGGLDAPDFKFPRLSSDLARPVAAAKYLLAISQGKVTAIDAITGEIVREFPGLTRPKELLYRGDILVAADKKHVRAFSITTGQELWSMELHEARNLVASEDLLILIHGLIRRGEPAEAVAFELKSGTAKWRTTDYPWLNQVTRLVLYGEHLAFEVSTLNNDDQGNVLHIASAKTGELLWDKSFPPGMNHKRQARAMFVDDKLWILHGGKINTAVKENLKHVPIEVSALDFVSGKTLATYPAGLAHCFPPVATRNYLFAGVFDMTDLRTGKITANRITKANCSLENGWVPANGLIYTSPKHCTCWPMLRGYVGLAAGSPLDEALLNGPIEKVAFVLERGEAKPDPGAPEVTASDWPLYRNDASRSGSTSADGPASLRVRWSVPVSSRREAEIFAELPRQPILHDWRENPFVKGPLSAPTVAHGLVYIAQPDAHEVVAIDAASGKTRWRFTADGRVDTPPAIHRGLCLFGTHAGSVFALRADTGKMVWRLHAGLGDEQIVAYGQLESPWPVPGAVLMVDDVAYFAAGRQSFADGGVLVFAVDPLTGKRHWVRRINTVPQDGYYENSALEFDPTDILHAEGDRITMSRWTFERDGRPLKVDKWAAFAKLSAGHGSVWVPRGSWTYGPRHVHRFPGEAPRRPLVVFRDHSVFASLNGTTTLFRRDFDLEGGEVFDSKWITGWEAASISREGGKPYRTYRLAKKASWTTDVFTPESERNKKVPRGTQLHNDLHALALAGNGLLYVVHKDGRLKVLSTADGKVLETMQVPQPVWDGLAIAQGRLYLTTQTGRLLCLAAKGE